ncbi:kinesin-like protein KIF26B isoform X3 [Anneissia japonica]|uniref:kinesin-like protein KIF26B isoform X3 n=1 Tax=Anneissia japonica TaxID=1529436 RepID=UPI0014254D00|nr:kinesin-like protein KIF26B isoform X3 [Anneissia japonica]
MDTSALCERLQVPKHLKQNWMKDQCNVCTTSAAQLKHEAISMVQSLEATQVKKDSASARAPSLAGPRDLASLQRYVYTQQPNEKESKHHPHRQMRQGRSHSNQHRIQGASPVAMEQTKKYLEENFGSGNYSKAQLNSLLVQRQNNIGMPNGSKGAEIGLSRGPIPQNLASIPPERLAVLQTMANQQVLVPLSNGVLPRGQMATDIQVTAASLAGTSAAASFFARAAQKLNLSSKKKKRHHQGCLPPELPPPDPPLFPTNFCQTLRVCPPAAPPSLLRNAGRIKDAPGAGKVKVMLRVVPSSNPHDTATFVTVDQKKKQVTLFDPSFMTNPASSSNRRTGVTAPKMFAFDSVFPQDSSQAEVCAASIGDIVQAVVNGADGCLFCYGHSRLGKSFTMIGRDDSVQNLGVIPCAIEWLFRLINEKKEKTSTRFSVRVSAVEVHGKQENLKDLLADQANGSNNGCGTSPGIYLAEDPICGVQLLNQSELRAPSAEKAAFYLDAAIAARKSKTYPTDEPVPEEESRNSHMLFTLHVYQYRFEKSGKGGVMGGRSRLHLIDLGSCDKGSRTGNGQALSFSSLGNVVLALLNSDKHIPHRDSKLTQLLRESLGSINCRATMIAHVSSAISCYNETLSTIQQAARIHRRGKKKAKYSGTSSSGGDSSCEEGRRRRPHFRSIHTRNINGITVTNAIRQSDPEYISSSEQSCDTVIYVGPDGCALSDRDLTDNEGPPESVPIFKPSLGRVNESRNVSNDELHSRLSKIDDKISRKDELKKSKKDSGSESDTARNIANHMKTVDEQQEQQTPSKKSGIPRPSKSSTSCSNKRTKKLDSLPIAKQATNDTPNTRTEIKPDVNEERVQMAEQIVENSCAVVIPVAETPDDDEDDDAHNTSHDESIIHESNFENIKRLAGHVEELSPDKEPDYPKMGMTGRSYNQQNTQHNLECLTQSVSMPTFTDVRQACRPEGMQPNMDMISDYVNGNLNGEHIQLLYNAERVIHSVESLDTIAELLERPVSELSLVRSEDEMSLVYSEVGSFVSTKTDDLTSLDQAALTIDDMPLGSEACCIATLDRQSLDSLSENFDTNLNTASLCANTNNQGPYRSGGVIDKELRNLGHYVYSDDESEVGEKKAKDDKMFVEKAESVSSVEIRMRDLDAIKSMYVISNLSVDDLLTDDPNEGSISTMADFDIPSVLMDEPQVVTYMTVEGEGQVVMREKHLAVDHPLRRLSCISDATDATFSTCSRPSSFISQEDDESADFSSGFNASDIHSVEEKVYSHPGYVPIYAMHLFDKMTDENAEVWEKMDTLTREASQKRRMSNQSQKNSASSESSRTISHLDTNTILPCAKVNPLLAKLKAEAVDPRGYTSEDNCLRGSLHKHRQLMSDEPEPEERKVSQKMSQSQSEPTSIKASPLHHTKINQFNVEPLPEVLCNAIAKVQEKMSVVEKEEQPVTRKCDMWLLRQPDGAAANDIQSEPEMGLRMYERKNHFRHQLKYVEEKEVFEAVRPPTIGACSSPTFDVEDNPCYSQDYDSVAETGINKVASKTNASLSSSETNGRERPKSRGILKPKIFSKSDKSKSKKSDNTRNISMQGKSYSDTESSCRSNLLSSRRTNSSSKLPTRTSSPSQKSGQTARNALKSAKTSQSQTKCKDSPPTQSSSKKSAVSKIPTAKPSPTNKGKTASTSPKHQATSATSRGSSLPVRNKSLSKSAPTLSKNSTNNAKQNKSATSSLSDYLPANSSPQSNNKLKVGNRLTDSSDSGNDSGIVCAEKSPAKVKTSFLSPYSTMTEPRTNRCSSSGHGSDNSSTVSDFLTSKLPACTSEETSSGYDSMLRDSESAHESIRSSSGKVKALRQLKRKLQGPRRCRSASPKAQTEQTSHRGGGNGGSRWIDLPPRKRSQDEGGVALKLYNVDKVKACQAEGVKGSPKRNRHPDQESRQERIFQLSEKQHQLKQQLMSTKALLNAESSCWTFDCR